MKWMAVGILVLLAGAWLQLGLLVLAIYVLAGLVFLGIYLSHYWSAALQVERSTLPPVLERGESVVVSVAVRNLGQWGIPWLLLEDALPIDALTAEPRRLAAKGSRVSLTDLGAGQAKLLDYELEFCERGYYQIGPLLIENGDVFGMHRRFRVLDRPQFVAVLPEVVRLESYDIASRRPLGEVRLAHRLFEDPTRLAGVRPCRFGDPLNRIHWRASARSSGWQCKVFDPSCLAGATLLLDFHQNSFSGTGAGRRRELAVTTAASVAHALCEWNEPVGLVTNGRDAAERIREEGYELEFLSRDAARAAESMLSQSSRLRPLIISTRREGRQAAIIGECLARLEPTDGLRFHELLIESGPSIPRDSSVVAILASVDATMALALGNLRRQGMMVTVLVVVFDELDLSAWAKAPEWAELLLSEGIEFRRIENHDSLARLGHPIHDRVL